MFREACESLGEGYFELLRGLLSPHLGEDPFSRVLDDPRGFLRSLRVALGSEADSFLAALASTLRCRGAEVNAKSLESTLESGDRARVRALFESAGANLLEGYRELVLNQLSGLYASRRRRIVLSSLLLGAITFSLIYLITLMLRDYVAEQTLGFILMIGSIISVALALENYMINTSGVPKALFLVRVRVVDASSLSKTRLPELIESIRGSGEFDLIELSRATSIPLPDLMRELLYLQREGAVRLEFRR